MGPLLVTGGGAHFVGCNVEEVYQKLNGIESQRTPISKLLARAIRYLGFFGVREARGSCWRFLGRSRICFLFSSIRHPVTSWIGAPRAPACWLVANEGLAWDS